MTVARTLSSNIRFTQVRATDRDFGVSIPGIVCRLGGIGIIVFIGEPCLF